MPPYHVVTSVATKDGRASLRPMRRYSVVSRRAMPKNRNATKMRKTKYAPMSARSTGWRMDLTAGSIRPRAAPSEFRPQAHEDAPTRRRVEVRNVGEDVAGRLVLEVGQVLCADLEGQRLRVE